MQVGEHLSLLTLRGSGPLKIQQKTGVGNFSNIIACMESISEFAVILCLIVFATQFADAFEQSTPFFTKIWESKSAFCPVLKGLEHIDIPIDNLVD